MLLPGPPHWLYIIARYPGCEVCELPESIDIFRVAEDSDDWPVDGVFRAATWTEFRGHEVSQIFGEKIPRHS